MMELIDRKELLRILHNGSNYNGGCPDWIIQVITHMDIKNPCKNCLKDKNENE